MSLPASLAGLALGLCVGAAGLPAMAQTVYRCGAGGGSYSQQPCAEGRAVALEGAARGAPARREGAAAAERQSRAAELLETERQRREATAPRAASLGRSRSGDPSFAPGMSGATGKKVHGPSGAKKDGVSQRKKRSRAAKGDVPSS